MLGGALLLLPPPLAAASNAPAGKARAREKAIVLRVPNLPIFTLRRWRRLEQAE